MSTKQERIAELAKQSPEMAFTSLAYLMDIEWLQEDDSNLILRRSVTKRDLLRFTEITLEWLRIAEILRKPTISQRIEAACGRRGQNLFPLAWGLLNSLFVTPAKTLG